MFIHKSVLNEDHLVIWSLMITVSHPVKYCLGYFVLPSLATSPKYFDTPTPTSTELLTLIQLRRDGV